MIKFNFEVEEVDAQMIFDCIGEHIVNCKESIAEELTKEKPNQFNINWLNSHIRYVENLKSRMRNWKVNNSVD